MLRRSISLLVVTLLVAGCAAQGSPKSSATVENFPPTELVQSLHLPFDAYTLSLAELYTLENAQDWLTRECMTARRYDWKVIERPTKLKDLRNRRRYGVVEMEIARQYGYHVPAGLITPLAVDQTSDRRDDSLTEQQKETAYGEGGCAREAVTRLRPKADPDLGLLQRLDRGSLADSQKDSQVAAAMRSWQACVRRLGFDYRDPFAAMSDARWWADASAPASSQEIAVAVADVGCKEQTGLVTAWHAAEARVQAEAIRTHPDEFQELRAAVTAEVTAAEAVLAQQDR